jgi:hypothetical protein
VDNGGEDASAPAPAAESRSEMVTPVPEMDDDDLDLAFGVGEASPRESERRSDKATASLDTGDLRIPSVPPSPPRITIPPIKPEIPPRETTAPPLNLDDLLGSGDQIAPEKSTLSTPPSPSGANPLRLSLGPPPPDDRDETPPGLSVTDLEETQTLSIPAAGGTQRRSVNDTQELDPREIDEVLSNIELEDETVTLHRDAADEDRDSRFLALCREGREASESGDWDEAVKIYRQALQVRPDSAEARHRLRTAEEAMQGTADATPSSPRTPGL